MSRLSQKAVLVTFCLSYPDKLIASCITKAAHSIARLVLTHSSRFMCLFRQARGQSALLATAILHHKRCCVSDASGKLICKTTHLVDHRVIWKSSVRCLQAEDMATLTANNNDAAAFDGIDAAVVTAAVQTTQTAGAPAA